MTDQQNEMAQKINDLFINPMSHLNFWGFVGAGIIVFTAVALCVQAFFGKRSIRMIEHLRKTGALSFITDALQLKRTLDSYDKPDLKKGFVRTVVASREQRTIQSEERRAITGTVCGEEIKGWVKGGVITLTVSRPETKKALQQALASVVNRDSELLFGLKLELNFM